MFSPLLLAAIAPAGILLWLFAASDEYPESASTVLITFGLGLLTIPALYSLQDIVYAPAQALLQTGNPYFLGAGKAFLMAAIPEETAKFLVLVGYSVRHKDFDEPMDGIVYGVAASLGFAALENVMYVFDGGYQIALARAVTAVPAHAMFGAVMGYYVGRAAFASHLKASLYIRALAVPILLHGLYDLAPLTFKAARALDVPLSPLYTLGLMLFFIFMVQWQITIAARVTGILKLKQRRRLPRILWKHIREKVLRRTPLQSGGDGLDADALRSAIESCAAQPPLGREFAMIFKLAAIFCILVFAIKAFSGKFHPVDILLYGGLAAVFGRRARQCRRSFKALLGVAPAKGRTS